MENPDPKRRKLEESPSFQQETNLQSRPDPYGVPGGLQRRMSAQSSPEVLEVDEISKPDQSTPASEPQTGTTKVPKKVQWETLPREASPPSQPPTALRDISNKASQPRAKPPKSGKSGTELLVLTSEEASANSGDEDSDVDPDEGIPARLPAGVVRRRTRSSAGTASLSASASPAPPSSATRRTGSTLFSSASSSRRSSESGPAGAERRGSMGGARVRAVVQV